jgi:hypothetical protein
MYSLEQKLDRLPKGKLSKKADLAIRLRIYFAIFKEKFLISRPQMVFFGFKKAVMAVVLILFILSGTSAYAYSSNQVTRGHRLYGLKRAIEQKRLNFTSTSFKTAQLQSEFAKRRLAEAAVLSRALEITTADGAPGSLDGTTAGSAIKNSTEDYLARTIADADQAAVNATAATEKISEPTRAKAALEIVAEMRLEQEEFLQRLAGTIGLNASDETVDDIVLELDEIKKEKRRLFQAIGSLSSGKKEAEIEGRVGTTSVSRDEDGASTAKTAEPSQDSFKKIESRVEAIRQELTDKQVSPKKIENFSRRVENKLNKAREAIDQGKLNQAKGLLKASEALTNNSKHFFREMKAKELKDDREENREEKNSGSGKEKRRLEIKINKLLPFIERPRAENELVERNGSSSSRGLEAEAGRENSSGRNRD